MCLANEKTVITERPSRAAQHVLRNSGLCLLSEGQLSGREPGSEGNNHMLKRPVTTCHSRSTVGRLPRGTAVTRRLASLPALTSDGARGERGDHWCFGPVVDSGQNFKQQPIFGHGVDDARHGEHGPQQAGWAGEAGRVSHATAGQGRRRQTWRDVTRRFPPREGALDSPREHPHPRPPRTPVAEDSESHPAPPDCRSMGHGRGMHGTEDKVQREPARAAATVSPDRAFRVCSRQYFQLTRTENKSVVLMGTFLGQISTDENFLFTPAGRSSRDRAPQ